MTGLHTHTDQILFESPAMQRAQSATTTDFRPGISAGAVDRKFQRRVNELRKTDNITNWFYIAREYAILALVLAVPLTLYHYYEAWGLAWWWNVPVTAVAILLVGMCQHRIGNLGHEAGHYALFKNRRMNEFASNWFALYPLLGVTHTYRLQHLAHHQYLNDPDRDPDLIYMNYLGQRFRLPMPLSHFLWACVLRHVLHVPRLIKYVLHRAKFANMGGTYGPYKAKNRPSRWLAIATLSYLSALAVSLAVGVWLQNIWILALAPVVLLTGLLLFTIQAPRGWYMQTAVKPDISPRWASFQRTMFLTLHFCAMAWMTHWTGHLWPVYYFILWLVPLGTTFSFFMILREDIQHSNTEEGRYSHTRDFRGNPLIRWAVFPMGQAYHLAHHLYPMVPHYNLSRLDALLRETSTYRDEAIVVNSLLPPRHAR